MAAIEEIKTETGNDKLEFIQLDLLNLASVKKFTEQFKARHDQLHILMNNAGVMMCPFGLSKDGIETQFATNHVAHFYLTTLLLPIIERSGPSRIINVSSGAHRMPFNELDLENISNPDKYNKYIHYAKSKTCNILFTRELTKRLEAKGVNNVYVNCNHPGVIGTDLYRHIGMWMSVFFTKPEDGALTQLYLATSPEIEEKQIKGQYYVPIAVFDKPRGVAASEDEPAKLWEFTENLLKEKVPKYEPSNI